MGGFIGDGNVKDLFLVWKHADKSSKDLSCPYNENQSVFDVLIEIIRDNTNVTLLLDEPLYKTDIIEGDPKILFKNQQYYKNVLVGLALSKMLFETDLDERMKVLYTAKFKHLHLQSIDICLNASPHLLNDLINEITEFEKIFLKDTINDFKFRGDFLPDGIIFDYSDIAYFLAYEKYFNHKEKILTNIIYPLVVQYLEVSNIYEQKQLRQITSEIIVDFNYARGVNEHMSRRLGKVIMYREENKSIEKENKYWTNIKHFFENFK